MSLYKADESIDSNKRLNASYNLNSYTQINGVIKNILNSNYKEYM